ncbi:MAG: hypothetical protein AB7G06_07625 [Bdellovibrionales bacterium]
MSEDPKTYRGVPVDELAYIVKQMKPLLRAVYKNFLTVDSYRETWSPTAKYWLNRLHSKKTSDLLEKAQNARTAQGTARAIRASQIEEAFTFFEPYILAMIEQGMPDVDAYHEVMLQCGLFDANVGRASMGGWVWQTSMGHHNYFLNRGTYDESQVQKDGLYNAYIIATAKDDLGRFKIDDALRAAVEEDTEKHDPAIDPKWLEIEMSDWDGEDFTGTFDGVSVENLDDSGATVIGFDLATETEDQSSTDVAGVKITPEATVTAVEPLQRPPVNIGFTVTAPPDTSEADYPEPDMSGSDRAWIKNDAGGLIRSLRNLDEVRAVIKAELESPLEQYSCIRPAVIATPFAAMRLAEALAPRFQVFDSNLKRVMGPT